MGRPHHARADVVRPGGDAEGLITPFMIMYALHEGMAKAMPDNTMAPSLAESWKLSPDGRVYDFTLRKGVKFHNGDPVTAEDVKFSFERYKGTASSTLKERIAAVEVVGPHHVRIRLKNPWPDFLTFYTSASGAGWIVPKKYVEKVGDDGYKKAPVGAGPYKFVSFTPGVELVFEAFDQYWRKTPNVKRLVFRVIPDEATRLAALKRGEIDIVYSIRGELAEELQRTPGLTLKPVVIQSPQWVNFVDQWDPKSPWHDRRVRLAANLAVDRKAINQAITLGHSRLTYSMIPSTFDFYWQPPPYPFDPAQAKKLLAEAGYPNGFDAGEYFMDVTYANVQESVANYLLQIGIRSKLKPVERAAFWSRLRGQEVPEPRLYGERRVRQRGHAPGVVHREGRDLRVRQLPRHRLALQGPGGRAGSQEARGDAAQDPAARAREDDGPPDLGAGVPQRPRPARARVGARADPRARLLRALRRREAQRQVVFDGRDKDLRTKT